MRTSVTTTDAPAAIGPYSQAIRTEQTLWVSGQLGLNPSTGEMAGNDVRQQAEQAMQNLDAICREAGTTLARALRCTIYLVDMGDFAQVNEVYQTWFEEPWPARACVQVARLPKDGLVEIDAVVAMRE